MVPYDLWSNIDQRKPITPPSILSTAAEPKLTVRSGAYNNKTPPQLGSERSQRYQVLKSSLSTDSIQTGKALTGVRYFGDR